MVVNKEAMARRLHEKHGLPMTQTHALVETLFGHMKEALSAEGAVLFRGFGSFRVVARKAYTGKNPVSGEKMEVPARKTVVFKASDALKLRVNGGGEQ